MPSVTKTLLLRPLTQDEFAKLMENTPADERFFKFVIEFIQSHVVRLAGLQDACIHTGQLAWAFSRMLVYPPWCSSYLPFDPGCSKLLTVVGARVRPVRS